MSPTSLSPGERDYFNECAVQYPQLKRVINVTRRWVLQHVGKHQAGEDVAAEIVQSAFAAIGANKRKELINILAIGTDPERSLAAVLVEAQSGHVKAETFLRLSQLLGSQTSIATVQEFVDAPSITHPSSVQPAEVAPAEPIPSTKKAADKADEWPREYLDVDETFAVATKLWPEIKKVLEDYQPPTEPKDFNARWEPRSILYEIRNLVSDRGVWYGTNPQLEAQVNTSVAGTPAFVIVRHPNAAPDELFERKFVFLVTHHITSVQAHENMQTAIMAQSREAAHRPTQTWFMLSYIGAMVNMNQRCREHEARDILSRPIDTENDHHKAEWWQLRKTFGMMLAADALSDGAFTKALKGWRKILDETPNANNARMVADLMAKKPLEFWYMVRGHQQCIAAGSAVQDAELGERIAFEARAICSVSAYTLDPDRMNSKVGVDDVIELWKELGKHRLTLDQAIERVVLAAKQDIEKHPPKISPSKAPSSPLVAIQTTAPATTSVKPVEPKSATITDVSLEAILEANEKLIQNILARQLLMGAMITVQKLESPKLEVDVTPLLTEATKKTLEKGNRLGEFSICCVTLSAALEKVIRKSPSATDENWQANLRDSVGRLTRKFLEDKGFKHWINKLSSKEQQVALVTLLGSISNCSVAMSQEAPFREGSKGDWETVHINATYTLLRDMSRLYPEWRPMIEKHMAQCAAFLTVGADEVGGMHHDTKKISPERIRQVTKLFFTTVTQICGVLWSPTRDEQSIGTLVQFLQETNVGQPVANSMALYLHRLNLGTAYVYERMEYRVEMESARKPRFEDNPSVQPDRGHLRNVNVFTAGRTPFMKLGIDALSPGHEVQPTVPLPVNMTQEERTARMTLVEQLPLLHHHFMNLLRLQCPRLLSKPEILDQLKVIDTLNAGGRQQVQLSCPREIAAQVAALIGQSLDDAMQHAENILFTLPNVQERMRDLEWEVKSPLPKEKAKRFDDGGMRVRDADKADDADKPLEGSIADRLHLFLGLLLAHEQKVWAHPEQKVATAQEFPQISTLEGKRILIVCPGIDTSFILTGGGGHLYQIPGVHQAHDVARMNSTQLQRFSTTLTHDVQAAKAIDQVLEDCKNKNVGLMPLGSGYYVEELRDGTAAALDALIVDLEVVAKLAGKTTIAELTTTDFAIKSGEIHFRLGGVANGYTFLQRCARSLLAAPDQTGELTTPKQLSATLCVLRQLALTRQSAKKALEQP